MSSKKDIINKKIQTYIPQIVCACLLGLWGGIYDFSLICYGIVFGAALLCHKKGIKIPVNAGSIGLFLMFLGFCISSIIAGDRGIAVIGIIRILVFILFWLLWCNLKTERKEHIWAFLPDIVSGWTAITIILYFVSPVREYFFHAGRMGGVFQYSNTYALLLLIALIILFYRHRGKKTDYLEILILLLGIIFCGSRSVMVFAVVSVLFLTVRKRISGKQLLFMAAVVFAAIILAQIFLELDLQRLLQLNLQSSTLNGRILYWRDTATVLMKHPFGLGYMGYFFRQPQFQTGNYVTKYVHNDFLQFGMDAGVLAMAGLALMIIANIFFYKNAERNRVILIILFLHMLFDFDLQYGFMFVLLLMCLYAEGEKEYLLKREKIRWMAGILTPVCVYFGLALGLSHADRQKASLTLYPFNTFAMESLMKETEDETLARTINERNGMIAAAHEYAARFCLEKQQYEEAYEEICAMVHCAGYESYYYNQAVYYSSICLDQAIKNDDTDMARVVLEQIQQMPDLIAHRESSASKFAFRINDKPEIELEDEIVTYIERLSDVSF